MKKIICLFLALSIIFMLSFSAFASSNSDLYYNDYGYLTYLSPSFNSSKDFSSFFSFNPTNLIADTPEFSIPSGMTQFCYSVYTGSNASRCTLSFVYCSDGSIPKYFSSSIPSVDPDSGSSFYEIRFYVDASGTASPVDAKPVSNISLSHKRASFLIPIQDSNGNILRPASDVQFTLNTAVIGYNLAFNSQINLGDSTVVDYYIFPSSVSISSGSSSSIVPLTSASELTPSQQENFFVRGFNAIKRLGEKFSDLITDISSPKVSLSITSSARSSSMFDPASFGVAYEKIGVGRLYSFGDTSITPTASLSLKDMISSHTGVYAFSTLKLVAVVNTSNNSFIATFDFAPASIVGGSPVPPSTLQGQVPYPDFDKPNSDFKDLADYLKQLMQAQTDNAARTNSNLIANLMAMPWADYVGTGFGSQLPNLSMYLDSLFDGLFAKYTAPSEEQINSLVNDVYEERQYLREKLAFVADVKSEVFFIQSTFISAGDSPRPFRVTLPSFMMGYSTDEHQEALVRYDLIDNNTRQAMHDVIIVFCTLAVVMHIWHTLPSTVGNMPRD